MHNLVTTDSRPNQFWWCGLLLAYPGICFFVGATSRRFRAILTFIGSNDVFLQAFWGLAHEVLHL